MQLKLISKQNRIRNNFKFSFKFKSNMDKILTFEMRIVHTKSLALMGHHIGGL